MTTALTTQSDHRPALERLTHLLQSPQGWNEDQAREMVEVLSQPARPAWTMAHVAALLHPYYEKDTPQAIREIEAEDWAHELRDYPQWAIKAAICWWKSADNKDRRKRPLEGDISARINVEMMAVRAAKTALRSGVDPHRYVTREVEERVTPEAAAEIMAQVGFAPKKFGGEA